MASKIKPLRRTQPSWHGVPYPNIKPLEVKPISYQRLNSAQWQIVLFRKWTLWWDAGRSYWHFEDYRKYGGNGIAQFTPIGTLHLDFSDLTLKGDAHGE